MMKKCFLCALLLSALSLTGCHSTSGTTTPQPAQTPVEQPSQPEQKPANNADNTGLPAADTWHSYYRDRKKDDIKALFEKAQKLVKEQKNVSGEINVWSKYFGQWIIIEIEEDKNNDIPEVFVTDEPPRSNPVFLVDMAAEKVIDMGDWRTAKPFFDAQVDAIKKGFSDDGERRTFIAEMASAASVLGLGHTRYLDYPSEDVKYPSPVSGPVYKHSMKQFELIYYVASNGMAMFYTKCTLTITDTSIVYNSEIVNLGEE